MSRLRFFGCTWFFFTFLSYSNAQMSPPTGDFIGVFRNTNLKQDQLAHIDLIPYQTNKGLELKAVLRLHFGDFSSTEYLTYRFDSISFDPKEEILTFKKPAAELTLKVKKSRDPQNELVADAWSSYTGDFLGTFFLKSNHRQNTAAELPLVESLWGEYKGKCDGVMSYLQIKVARTSTLFEGTENPYRSFKIFASFAEPDPSIGLVCHHIPPRPCVRKIYNSGIYNFHSGILKLNGTPSRICQVHANSITCEGCEYKRAPKPASERMWNPESHKDRFTVNRNVIDTTRGAALSGTYSGYLHHERLDVYQTTKIRVDAKPVDSGLQISAAAALYFGDDNSEERIDYRFDPIATNEPMPASLLFYTEGPRTDALLQITSFTDSEISGVWYSSLYGKVGRFQLKKGSPLRLPDNAVLMEPVGGHYLWSVQGKSGPLDFDLFLPVIHQDAPPYVFPAQPFFPLDFNSYWTNRQGVLKKTAFPGGSYDFFTGRISYGNVFLGFRRSRKDISLVTSVVSIIGAPLGPDLPEPVTYIEPLEY